MTSHHPDDELHGYCGNCCAYTTADQPAITEQEIMAALGIEAHAATGATAPAAPAQRDSRRRRD
jgi:hypothetical protein